MTYYDYLCRLLEPMRVYRTEHGTLSGGELYAAGKALDKADGAMLARSNADSFTLDAINSTLSGCGIKALAEETEKKGSVKVWFPNTVGVPDEFSQVESIILDIIP